MQGEDIEFRVDDVVLLTDRHFSGLLTQLHALDKKSLWKLNEKKQASHISEYVTERMVARLTNFNKEIDSSLKKLKAFAETPVSHEAVDSWFDDLREQVRNFGSDLEEVHMSF